MSLHQSNDELMSELDALKARFAAGQLSQAEFEKNRVRLVDKMTATQAVVIVPESKRGTTSASRVKQKRASEKRRSSKNVFEYDSDESTEMIPPDEEAPLSPRAQVPNASKKTSAKVGPRSSQGKSMDRRSSLQLRPRGVSVPEVLKQLKQADKPKARPHAWQSKQLNKFTWCDHCNEFIYGLVLQGLQCERCDRIIHRKCKFKVGKDCGITIKVEDEEKNDASDGGGLPHVFELHHFSRFTYCALCQEFIYGLAKQGFKCRLCGYPCHKDCKFRVLKTCSGTMSSFAAPDIAELNLHVNREALVKSCVMRLDEEMGISEDVGMLPFGCETEWNSLFVSLESDDVLEESSLQEMMQVVRKVDDTVKEMEKTITDDSSAELVKSCLVLSAEINLAKSEITKRWDYQQSTDDLRRVRSSGLNKREQALEDSLLKPTNHAILLLFDQLAGDGGDRGGDAIARALLDVMVHHGSQLKLIEFFVELEVRRCSTKSTLFRSNSLSTKILRAYCKQESSEFVKHALLDPVTKLTEFNLEIDPKKLLGEDAITAEEVQVRKAHLHMAIKIMLESIIAAREHLSSGVFEVCACVHNIVGAKFPDSAISAVGGIVFLRVLSPVIVSPFASGLVKEQLDPCKKRTLMLIGKAMQCMSNQVEFSPSYLRFLTPLCADYRRRINEFLLSLTMEPTFDDTRVPPSRDAVRKNQKNLTFLREYLKNKDKSLLAELVEDPLLLEELEQII